MRLYVKNIFILSVWMLAIIGCDNIPDPQAIECDSSIDSSINIKIDTLTINIDNPQLTNYDIFSVWKASIVCYNEIIHALDIFDLQKQQFVKSIQLDDEGPNGIGRISAIDIMDLDNFIILTENLIFKISKEGKVLERITINDGITDTNFNKYFIHVEDNSLFKYNNSRNSLFVSVTTIEYPRENRKYYDESNSILAEFFLV